MCAQKFTVLILALQIMCIERWIYSGWGASYHVSDYGESKHILNEISCTFVNIVLPREYDHQKSVIECARICNANIDCAYFVVNETQCVLCEKYAGYVPPDTKSTITGLLDVAKVYTKAISG